MTMQAGQNVRDGAARTYDWTANTLRTPVKDQDWGYGNEDRRGVMDKAGEYYQGAKDTVNDAAYRTGDAVSNAAGATKDAATKVTIFIMFLHFRVIFFWQQRRNGLPAFCIHIQRIFLFLVYRLARQQETLPTEPWDMKLHLTKDTLRKHTTLLAMLHQTLTRSARTN